MDPSDFPVSKSPRRELQGPRPAPLKVRKDSHKIKKPPVPPPPPQPHQQQQHHQAAAAPPPRPPVVIYTVSPKVIHTHPNDFMNLVQRLTGPPPSTASFTSTSTADDEHSTTGAVSPAARYASIEKTKLSPKLQIRNEDHNIVEGIEMDHNIERSSLFPGILSPGPTSLPIIPPSFFSPPSDPNTFSFLHDLSPVLHGNKNFAEPSFMLASPSAFISRQITSPTPSIDLFNNFFDF